MAAPAIHIIGAGLAGLAAALRLAEQGARVIVHEAANQAGGRCRSYHDPALGMTIDNGNHLLLSGNRAALDYLRAIGAQDRLAGPDKAEFLFADLKTGARWTLRPNDGRLPWWIFDTARRVPDTRARDYLSLLPLLRAGPDQTIADVMACRGVLYELLWQPLFLAALNTDPSEASAQLAAAIVRETLMAGGKACRPLIAKDGLGAAFIDPALRYLESQGVAVRFGQRLRAMSFAEAHATALDFGEENIALAPGDAVILAVPPTVASSLVPDLTAPTQFRAIANAHFRLAVPRDTPMMTGLINSISHWLFAFEDRLSVTVSGADHLLEVPRETLARDIWREVAAVTGLPATLPDWQIVRERRATFAALPNEDRKRPATRTRWGNLVLAGDWTATGLPATIEGAIRSGNKAAESLENITHR
jgi:squalene-associated FAD-dependent desaturase